MLAHKTLPLFRDPVAFETARLAVLTPLLQTFDRRDRLQLPIWRIRGAGFSSLGRVERQG